MAEFKFELSYAGVPLCLDDATPVRMVFKHREGLTTSVRPPEKHQPEPTLSDEINRRIDPRYLTEFAPPRNFLGRKLAQIAHPYELSAGLARQVKVGEFFYPSNASRWSVFRGWATSGMVKELVKVCYKNKAAVKKKLIMKAAPQGAGEISESAYTVKTDMFLLPPRPLAECGIGTGFDGLYLVTLVDERWHWQWRSADTKLNLTYDSTWAGVISSLATALGITLTPGTISSTYLAPEPDSQFWTSYENAAVLLDAVAWNVGRVFVRKLDGTYALETNATSASLVDTNRGPAKKVVRFAGGDAFDSTKKVPAGDLTNAKAGVLPASVDVTFPYYVTGDNPVPHLMNSRYLFKRPSCRFEESVGKEYVKNVTLAAAGKPYSDFTGVASIAHTIHSTAKAEIPNEATTTPDNQTALDALALQLAQDYYAFLVGSALDEVYPGTYDWEPEGINDVLWRYTGLGRQASTRVFRQEWNQMVSEFQHSDGMVKGVGGPSVAQTWRCSFSGSIANALSSNLASGGFTAAFTTIDRFPTQNRWKGTIDAETILFEGTSGGLSVGIVKRGIDGSTQALHSAPFSVTLLNDQPEYGVNSVRAEKMQFMWPGEWTSGGVQGVSIVPQTQTVRVLANSGAVIKGIWHYSGRVLTYDASAVSGSQFPAQELCWVVERNAVPLRSGIRYDGQVVDHSFSGPNAPIYAVCEYPSSGVEIRHWNSGGITSGFAGPAPKIDFFSSGGIFLLTESWPSSGTVSLSMTVSGVQISHRNSGNQTSGYVGPQPKWDFISSGGVTVLTKDETTSGTLAISFQVNSGTLPSGTLPYDIGCKLYHSTSQTVTAGTSGFLTFNSEERDTHAFHAAGSGTIIQFSGAGVGWYSCSWTAEVAIDIVLDNSVQDALGSVILNGTTEIRGSFDQRPMWQQSLRGGDGSNSGATVIWANEKVELGRTFDFEVTTRNTDRIEVLLTPGAVADGTITRQTFSVHKINAGATV